VDPAQGVRTAPAPVVRAEPPDAPAAAAPQGAPAAPPNRGFMAFEPMVAITNALNLAQKGVYKDLQSIAPGGSWEESFWVRTKGY
jgi:aldose 1-epimerase